MIEQFSYPLPSFPGDRLQPADWILLAFFFAGLLVGWIIAWLHKETQRTIDLYSPKVPSRFWTIPVSIFALWILAALLVGATMGMVAAVSIAAVESPAPVVQFHIPPPALVRKGPVDGVDGGGSMPGDPNLGTLPALPPEGLR
jgi:hypothetical protein